MNADNLFAGLIGVGFGWLLTEIRKLKARIAELERRP